MNWANDRFEDIRAKLGAFLTRQAGFRESDITYVPCSGLMGINLTKKPSEPNLTSWYSGGTLLDAIGKLNLISV
jgi:elongation factor 1 alpha-like protein